MAYTVLARRYRSQTFGDVVGQVAISQTLQNAIKTDKVAHAYLFTGTRGVGKTTTARILAKSLNCLASDKPTVEPCLKCDSCAAVNTGEDIDVIEIDGASNRGIENVRELRNNAIYRPARARFKIYIIDEVHMLTTEAFNALLKILEEPPAHIKFIFATTEPNKVPATIQSRCQRFDFTNISPADIITQLKKILVEEKIKFEDDCIIALARLANGSMRDALSLLDQLISAAGEPLTVKTLEELLGLPSNEKTYLLLEKIGQSDAGGTLQAVDDLIVGGLSCIGLLDALVQSFRDMMVFKAAKNSSTLLILTEAEKKGLSKVAEYFDIPSIVYNISLFEKLRWPVKNSDNPRALLEASLLRVALSEHFMSIPDLLGGKNSNVSSADALKKNTGVTERPAFKQPVPVSAPQQRQVIEGNCAYEKIKENWGVIIESITNSRMGDFLKKASPLGLNGGVLALGFNANDEFTMQLCQNNGRAEAIAEALSQACGTELRTSFELINQSSQNQAKPKPKGAKASKQVIDDAANSPFIKSVLSELEANIIDVEEQQ
ncbi:MAG: DNA polymerase III, subunit gamma and tau [Planctomycetes bacterium GWF2_41_51]|nr:MAG: DNA polymerase III, subunit gamma and tau [Planctomycetes bacterium GWF2_41_51]